MLDLTKRAFREIVREQIVRAHVEGTRRYGVSRRITPSQEMAYRLCHHDFCGLSQANAAEVLETSQSTISRLLAEIEREAPQLFPILSPRVAKMYEMFMEGYTCKEIAGFIDVSPRAVQKAIRGLYRDRNRLGLWFQTSSQRRLVYAPWMDEVVKERF